MGLKTSYFRKKVFVYELSCYLLVVYQIDVSSKCDVLLPNKVLALGFLISIGVHLFWYYQSYSPIVLFNIQFLRLCASQQVSCCFTCFSESMFLLLLEIFVDSLACFSSFFYLFAGCSIFLVFCSVLLGPVSLFRVFFFHSCNTKSQSFVTFCDYHTPFTDYNLIYHN